MLVTSFLALAASAAEASKGGPNRYVVDVEVDAAPELVARVRAVSTEVLDRLDVTPIVTRESPEGTSELRRKPPPLAYAYIDLEVPTLPRLVVVEGGTRRELTRRTLPESASAETSIEAVTLVLYMTLESLISGSEAAPAAPTRRAPGQLVAEPVLDSAFASPEHDAPRGAARRDNEALAVDVGAFLRIMTLDNANALAGGGGAVEIRAERLTPRLGALLFAAAHSSADLSFDGTRVKLTPFSARILPTLSMPLAPRISGLIGIGAGIDWFRTEVRDAPAGAQGAGTSSTAGPTMSALVAARAHFSRYLSMNVAAGLDLDASPRVFVVVRGNERQALLEVSRLRPSLMLGVALSPTGAMP